MTTQESFKKRIRARMARTGERYGAARRALVDQAGSGRRVRVSEPEVGDERVRDATGRDWDGWCDLVDARPDGIDGHTAVAAWLHEHHALDPWWSQTVTVGWERITGARVPGQMADGTFQIGRTRTVVGDAAALLEMLRDDADRADLFGGRPTELRSRPTTKAPRVDMGEGVALFGVDDRGDGRMTVTVTHERLPDRAAASAWKSWWEAWLDALAELAAPPDGDRRPRADR